MQVEDTKKDFLIVGFGVVGLSLAKYLLDQNTSFDVIANLKPRASSVSGGLLNPVSLKRLKLAWNADLFHFYAVDFYSSFTQLLGQSYLQDKPIYRIFSSVEEQNLWFSQPESKPINKYLSPDLIDLAKVDNKFRSAKVIDSYLIRLRELISDFSNYLIGSSRFIQANFNYADLHLSDSCVKYNSRGYKHVIFADGYQVINNPFFNYLPIYGNKGEYLIVRCTDLSQDKIYKPSKFLIPLGQGLFKFGATYERDFTDDLPSASARLNLNKELEKFTTVDFEIVDQVSAIRPTSKDRLPVSGQHPKHSSLFTLNAMGSRGIMSAPHLAKNLINSIKTNETIMDQVNVNRFTRKHFKSSPSLY